MSDVNLNSSMASTATTSAIHLDQMKNSVNLGRRQSTAKQQLHLEATRQRYPGEPSPAVLEAAQMQTVQLNGAGSASRRIEEYHDRASPTTSVLTASEFGDPDRRGRSRQLRKARDFLSSSFNGLLIMVPGMGGRSPPSRSPPNHSYPGGGGSNRDYDEDSDDVESRKGHRRRISCRSVLLLLAIDLFTIALVLILFSYLQDRSCEF